MLLSRPLIVHVQRGQIDLALASIAVLAYRRDYRWTAAVLLALAAFAKIAPAVLLISFVVPTRDWGFGICFALASLGIAGVSLLVVSPALYGFCITDVMPHPLGAILALVALAWIGLTESAESKLPETCNPSPAS